MEFCPNKPENDNNGLGHWNRNYKSYKSTRQAGKPPLVVTKHLLHKDTCTIHCILHDSPQLPRCHNLQLESARYPVCSYLLVIHNYVLGAEFFCGDVKLSTPHVTCWHQRHQLQHPQNGKKHPNLCECETRHATNYEELLVFTLPETITASSHLKLGLFLHQFRKFLHRTQPLRKSGAKMWVSGRVPPPPPAGNLPSKNSGIDPSPIGFWNVQNSAICGQEDHQPVGCWLPIWNSYQFGITSFSGFFWGYKFQKLVESSYVQLPIGPFFDLHQAVSP